MTEQTRQDLEASEKLSKHPFVALAAKVVNGEIPHEQAYAQMQQKEFLAKLDSDGIEFLNEHLFRSLQDLTTLDYLLSPTWYFLLAQFNYEACKNHFHDQLGKCALTLGFQLQRMDRYDNAIHFYFEALQNLSDGAPRREAMIYNYLGTAFHYKNDLSNAITHYQHAIAIADRIGDRYRFSKAIGNLGVAYQDSGDNTQAVACYERALAISREFGDRWEEARELECLGSIYQEEGQVPKAMEYFQKGLTISRDLSDRHGEASLLNKLGTANVYAGESKRAVDYFKESLQILSSEISDPRMTGAVLSNLGQALRNQGEVAEAQKFYQQALDLAHQLEDRRGEAEVLANIAATHYTSGEIDEAVFITEQALKLFRKMGDRRGEALCLGNLSMSSLAVNRAEQAIRLAEQALTIAREISNPREEATQLANLANAFYEVGLLAEAAYHFAQAIDVCQRIGDLKTESESWTNLGLIARARDEMQQAKLCYGKGLGLSRKINDRRGQIGDLANLGVVHLLENEFARSENCFQEALALARDVDDRRAETACLANLGHVSACLNKMESSLEYYNQAIEIAKSRGYLELLFRSYYGLGLIREISNREEAYLCFHEAIKLLEEMRSGFTEQEFKMGFLREKDSVFEKMIEMLCFKSEQMLGKLNLNTSTELLKYIESAKSRTLLEVLGNPRLRMSDFDLNDPEVQQERQLRNELERHFLNLRRGGFFVSQDQGTSAKSTRLAMSGRDLDYETYMEISSQHRRVVNRLRSRHPQWASLQYVDMPSVEEVHSFIPKNTALVDYFVTPSLLVAMVIDRDNVHVVKTKNSEIKGLEINGTRSIQKYLSKRVENLRNFAAPSEDRLKHVLNMYAHSGDLQAGKAADRDFWKFSQELYETLIRPVEKLIHDKESLIISSHGDLHYLPFQMLWDGAHYLVEKYAISYVPNAGLLKYCQAKVNTLPTSALVLGNPHAKSHDKDDTQKPAMRSLEMAETEAENIARLFGARAFKGRDATASLFKREGSKHQIVHLACHGDFAPENVRFTALLLAADGQHNGRMTVQEIMEELNLEKTELAVLSACELGLGRQMPGDDLLGMTRAFMYAGVPSVMVSLWSVNDRSTAELMVSFYQNLKAGFSKAQSLSMAQRLMLTKARQAQDRLRTKSYTKEELPELMDTSRKAHPYFWAPFVLVGNPN